MERRNGPNVEERRPAVRQPVDFAASFSGIGGVSGFEGRVTELSASGLRLRTGRGLSIGTSLEIAFAIAHRSRRSDLKLVARVVRLVLEDPPRFEYALVLVDADPDLRSILREVVLHVRLGRPARERRYY